MRRSPIVGAVCSGRIWLNAPCGFGVGCIVLTAQLPQTCAGAGGAPDAVHETVSGLRATGPVGVYSGYATGIPLESMIEWLPA